MAVPRHRRHFLFVHHRVPGSSGQDRGCNHSPHFHDLSYHTTILPTLYAHRCIFNMVLRLQVSQLAMRLH